MKRFILLASIFFVAHCALAQNTGFPIYGSFENGRFDTVNRQDLNTVFTIPIISQNARGMAFNFSLSYNSLLWNHSTAWSSIVNAGGSATWGWNTTAVTGGISSQVTNQFECNVMEGGHEIPFDSTTWSHYAFTEPDGTVHPFNVSFTEKSPQCGGGTTGTNSGYATDASGYYLSGGSSVIAPSGINFANSGQTDTNGNFVSSTTASGETDWTDTAGRLALKVISSATNIKYEYQDTTGSYQTITLNLTNYNVKTNFGCSGVVEYTSSGTIALPSSIVYPNGTQYSFTYEPTPGNAGYVTGRVSKVTLPNGGTISYTFGSTNDGINCSDSTVVNLTRAIYDGTNTATWQFSRAPSGSNWITTVTAPLMPYDTAANQSVFTFNSAGQETQQKFYQGSTGGTLLRTINKTWAANLTPATTITILDDNSTQSEVETTYDGYGNLGVLKEHDYGTGAPGAVLRTTNYTYSSAYTTQSIMNRVTEKTIADSTGTIQYREDTAYDGTTLGPCPTGVSQHNDTTYGCTFSARGNPTSFTTYTNASTPSGSETKTSYYDMFGNLVQADLDCCQLKKWSFSATTQYSQADSDTCGATGGPQLTTNYTYNTYTGQPMSKTDPNNQITLFTYDTMRRSLIETRPDTSQIKYSYNDSTHTITTSNPVDSSHSSNKIEDEDGLGRVVQASITDASSNVYSIGQVQYDPLGRMYKQSNPYTTSAQYWASVQFDALGRKTTQILQDNSQMTYSFSLSTLTSKDPAGHQRKSQLDGLQRLVISYEPDPTNGNSLTLQTSYTNSVLNKVASLTQGSQTRTFNYDGMGRLISEVHPENGTTSYQYNSFDKLTRRTDNRGVITTYSYDTLNRPYQTIYNVGSTGVPATATVTYSYGSTPAQNNNGRLLSMTDGTGSQTYTYDVMGRVTQDSQVVSGTSYPVSYQYNYDGSVTSLTYPSGRVVQPTYDAIGRPATVASGAITYVSGITFNPNFSVSGMSLGNGVAETLSQSPDRLQLHTISYSASGTTIFGETYTYNSTGANNGEISSISDSVDSGRNMTYTYDALNRVSTAVSQGSANYPKWGLSWNYDRYGNRLSQSVTAGSAYANSVVVSTSTNQITTSGYAYDANGNMTNDGVNALVYDAENRAISAADGSGTGLYSYNGSGLRVQKTLGAITTTYILNGNNVIAEYVNGTLGAEYIRLGSGVVAQYNSGTLNYVGRDRLSTRILMDTSGNVLGSQGHYPFGEDWYMNSPTAKWHFTSYERDSESGNDYAKFRYHANRLGRFLTVDPVRPSSGHSPQSLNRYSYVASDPIDRKDPNGLSCVALDSENDCTCYGFADFGDVPLFACPAGLGNSPDGGGRSEGGCSSDSLVEGSSCPPPEPTPPPTPPKPFIFTLTCNQPSAKIGESSCFSTVFLGDLNRGCAYLFECGVLNPGLTFVSKNSIANVCHIPLGSVKCAGTSGVHGFTRNLGITSQLTRLNVQSSASTK